MKKFVSSLLASAMITASLTAVSSSAVETVSEIPNKLSASKTVLTSPATSIDGENKVNYLFTTMGKTIDFVLGINYHGEEIVRFSGNEHSKDIPSMKTDSVSLTMKSDPSQAGMADLEEGLHFRMKSDDEKWCGNIGIWNADCKADISRIDNEIVIEKTGGDKNLGFYFDLGNSDNLCQFDGETDDKVSLKIQDDGSVIIKGQQLDLTGKVTGQSPDDSSGFRINAKGSVMLKDSKVLIDPDNDGVYSEIRKGDICSDGNIDASDASKILQIYADNSSSSNKKTYLNDDIADYNGDGIIDASDASVVLTYYADLSSGKIQ